MKTNSNALNPEYVTAITTIAQQFPAIQKIAVFGSWALGNAKRGSDIDLAIFGKDIDHKILAPFHAVLEDETIIPHFFDVLHFESLSSSDLIEHIHEHGVQIFP